MSSMYQPQLEQAWETRIARNAGEVSTARHGTAKFCEQANRLKYSRSKQYDLFIKDNATSRTSSDFVVTNYMINNTNISKVPNSFDRRNI